MYNPQLPFDHILTNEIHNGIYDKMSVKDHKTLKGIKKGILREHMTPLELAFTILGEASTVEEIKDRDAKGFEKIKKQLIKGAKMQASLANHLKRFLADQ